MSFNKYRELEEILEISISILTFSYFIYAANIETLNFFFFFLNFKNRLSSLSDSHVGMQVGKFLIETRVKECLLQKMSSSMSPLFIYLFIYLFIQISVLFSLLNRFKIIEMWAVFSYRI